MMLSRPIYRSHLPCHDSPLIKPVQQQKTLCNITTVLLLLLLLLLAGAMGVGGSPSEGKCCRAPFVTEGGGSCSVGSGVCW
jgi:hypothetical protein